MLRTQMRTVTDRTIFFHLPKSRSLSSFIGEIAKFSYFLDIFELLCLLCNCVLLLDGVQSLDGGVDI